MYKTIFIGGINRSGGSLLARLFDGHPDMASYPLELGFPRNHSYYSIYESITGIPLSIPEFDGSKDVDVFELLDIPKAKPKIITKWGKEQADPVGVRKNYLEKVFYGTVKTNFDFDQFSNTFSRLSNEAKNVVELYDARHKAYFGAWDHGKHSTDAKFVVMHDSAGIYLTNIDKFLNDFPDSLFIYPLRDVLGYIASEKTRLARRYFGSRRFSYPKFPNKFVKLFNEYDLQAQIRAWMVAITRIVLLQEKYGLNNHFIIYRNESLLNHTEKTMRSFCKKLNIEFDPIFLDPTIGGQPWLGNSHQGRRQGVARDLATYYPKVLRDEEINQILKATSPIRDYLAKSDDTPVNMQNCPKEYLLDYEYQKKYFHDSEKIALYYAVVNAPRRRIIVRAPKIIAVLAYLYSKWVQFLHIPRMLKLKYLPTFGKQNYT